LNDSHFEPQAVRPQHHRGDNDLEYQKYRFKRNTKPPYLTPQMSKWFTILPLGLLLEQSVEVRYWRD
jgi:hypothetical protein